MFPLPITLLTFRAILSCEDFLPTIGAETFFYGGPLPGLGDLDTNGEESFVGGGGVSAF